MESATLNKKSAQTPIGGGKNPADFLKVVHNPYLYGDPDLKKVPGVNFLIDTEAMSGRIPTNTWFNNLLLNRGAGSQPINAYVDKQEEVTDGLKQITYTDVKSLGAPCDLQDKYATANVPLDFNAPVNNQGTWNIINGYWGLRFSSRHRGDFNVTSIVNLEEHIMTAGVEGGFAPNGEITNCYSSIDQISTLGFRLNYKTADNGAFTSYHVQGCPYLTFGFKGNVTPSFNSNYQLLFIFSDEQPEGVSAEAGGTISGKQFTAFYFNANKIFSVIFYTTSSINFRIDYFDEYKTLIPGTVKHPGTRYVIESETHPAGTPMYSSFPVPTNSIGKLVATSQFEGIIRLANLPILEVDGVPQDGQILLATIQRQFDTLINTYDQYKNVAPISGEANITGSGAWTYKIQSAAIDQQNDPVNLLPNASKVPLMVLNQPDMTCYQGKKISGITFRTIKGALSFVAAEELTFNISVPSDQWFDDTVNVVQQLSPEDKAVLLQQFQDDNLVYGPNLGKRFTALGNKSWQEYWPAYTEGKQFLSLATFVLFYEKVLKDSGKTRVEILKALEPSLGSLKTYLGEILDQGFYYDNKTGMVIESSSLANAPYYTENFQNLMGQDHIFHYGYYVATAAILAHFDKEWFDKPLPSYSEGNYSDVVYALIRNVCNPTSNDPYFTTWRAVNWMQGHATASGLNSMLGDGLNEESFAEEANFWKGTQMWAKEMNNIYLEDLASTWLARCSLSLQSWVAVDSEACVYEDPVLEKLHENHFFSVCNIWSKKAQATTWFGGEQPVAIGIEVFTSIPSLLEELVDQKWLKIIHDYYSSPADEYPYRLYEVIDNLKDPHGEILNYHIWYSNLSPFFSMINPAFVIDIMNYKNFELDDNGMGLNTRSALMFVLAYYEAKLKQFAGMPDYQRPVPFYVLDQSFPNTLQNPNDDQLGWIPFLDPDNPKGLYQGGVKPDTAQLELVKLLQQQLIEWRKVYPLNGGDICNWARTARDNFLKDHPKFVPANNQREGGVWENILNNLLNLTNYQGCTDYLFCLDPA